jgi:hypothetical protein
VNEIRICKLGIWVSLKVPMSLDEERAIPSEDSPPLYSGPKVVNRVATRSAFKARFVFITMSVVSALYLALLLSVSLAADDIMAVAPGESIAGLITMAGDETQEISIVVPESVSEWYLVPSDTPSQKQIELMVRASSPWTITTSWSRSDCRMVEYDLASSEYVPSGMMLEDPVQVRLLPGADGSRNVELSSDGVMIKGQETGDAGREIELTLSQQVSWSDEPLPYGRVYRIDLLFSAVPAG